MGRAVRSPRPRSQRSSAPNNHRNSESELYSTVANRTMLAMEIHVDSLKKKTAFSACDVFQRSFHCPVGGKAWVRHRGAVAQRSSPAAHGKRSIFPERVGIGSEHVRILVPKKTSAPASLLFSVNDFA